MPGEGTQHGGRAGGEDPRVTTVVMTRNRWPDLRRSLSRHDDPVIVVDNGSSDGTPELVARHFPTVKVLRLPANLGAPARNVGAAQSHTPYVAFADDDSWWDPGALDLAAELLDAAPRLGLLAARILVGTRGTPDPVTLTMEESPLGREPDLPGPSVLGFLACGAVVRREAFLSVGGFDDVIEMYGEEQRLAWDLRDAGWGLAYVADVVARHHPSERPRPPETAALLERNRVLSAVLRRSWPAVAGEMLRSLRRGRPGRSGLRRALPRVPRALRRRRRLAAPVEREIRRLARQQSPGGPC
jgi:GT2 family glycosyltransferase